MIMFLSLLVALAASALSKQVNVLIIGVSGSGKSSLVQNVADIVGISRYQATPVTMDVKVYEAPYRIDNEDIDIRLVDTMGFASTDSTDKIIEKMEDIILEPTIVPSIHKVVILIKAERNNINSLNELNNVLAVLNSIGLKQANIMTYITHMDIYDKKTQNLMKGAVAEHYKDVLKMDPQVKCFANPNEIEARLKPIIAEWVERDVTEFVHRVVEDVVPFYPSDYKYCKGQIPWVSFMASGATIYADCLREQENMRNSAVVKNVGKRRQL